MRHAVIRRHPRLRRDFGQNRQLNAAGTTAVVADLILDIVRNARDTGAFAGGRNRCAVRIAGIIQHLRGAVINRIARRPADRKRKRMAAAVVDARIALRVNGCDQRHEFISVGFGIGLRRGADEAVNRRDPGCAECRGGIRDSILRIQDRYAREPRTAAERVNPDAVRVVRRKNNRPAGHNERLFAKAVDLGCGECVELCLVRDGYLLFENRIYVFHAALPGRFQHKDGSVKGDDCGGELCPVLYEAHGVLLRKIDELDSKIAVQNVALLRKLRVFRRIVRGVHAELLDQCGES